jgi:hypothetical protein
MTRNLIAEHHAEIQRWADKLRAEYAAASARIAAGKPA